MPALTTENAAASARASRREARISVHARPSFALTAPPSVTESPSVTMTRVGRTGATEMAVTMGLTARDTASRHASSSTASRPEASAAWCTPSLGEATKGRGRYTLTTSSLKFETARSTGSLTAAAPAMIAISDRPPKLTRLSVPVLTAAASPANPTLALPISRGRSPVSFDRRSRRRDSPALTRRRWRIVPCTGAGAAMMSSGTKWTGAAGLAPQVPIHFCIACTRRVGSPQRPRLH